MFICERDCCKPKIGCLAYVSPPYKFGHAELWTSPSFIYVSDFPVRILTPGELCLVLEVTASCCKIVVGENIGWVEEYEIRRVCEKCCMNVLGSNHNTNE